MRKPEKRYRNSCGPDTGRQRQEKNKTGHPCSPIGQSVWYHRISDNFCKIFGPAKNVLGMRCGDEGKRLSRRTECFRHALLLSETRDQPKTRDAHQARDDQHFDEALKKRRIEDLKVDPVFYEVWPSREERDRFKDISVTRACGHGDMQNQSFESPCRKTIVMFTVHAKESRGEEGSDRSGKETERMDNAKERRDRRGEDKRVGRERESTT